MLDKGKFVENRVCPMNKLKTECKNCNPCNILSGYGGAGTFSDGKLNTLVKEKYGRNKAVLETFVQFGAKESILYEAKPHIGTDVLCDIVKKNASGNHPLRRYCAL